MWIMFLDAHRALELLEEYYNQLNQAEDQALRAAIERVIRTFKSSLFHALLGIYYLVHIVLLSQLHASACCCNGHHCFDRNGHFWTTVNNKVTNLLSANFAQAMTFVSLIYVSILVAIGCRETSWHMHAI